MDTALERAARALGAVYDGDADPVETPNNWARAVSGVRAVLEAIRDPSEEMIWAGRIINTSADFTWQAMIDTALTE